MKPSHVVFAALVLALFAPQGAVAQDARIAPVLSTNMQRVCQIETTRTLLMSGGRVVDNPRPVIERATGSLQASRFGDGWVFLQISRGSAGDLTLRAETAADGAVTSATLSGSLIEAEARRPGAPVPALASAMADDVAERLLVGRAFDPGDSYYPEPLRRSLIQRLVTTAMGLPGDANGSVDIFYEGEVELEGRRAWRFAGPIKIAGQFRSNAAGRTVRFDNTSEAVALHDAETGLLLKYDVDGNDRTFVDEAPFLHRRRTQAFTCEIIPQ
jgi:hypothetical protein